MGRIISIVFAIFAVMFVSATAQAKPGLPSDSELIRVDCNTNTTQCVQLNAGGYQTIEDLIARESIQATPELAALTTDAATGIAFNLSSGAVAVRGYLPSGGFEVIWPPDYGVDKVEQLRELASARRWTREEFGLSARGRAKGVKFVVAKEIPLAQRLWLAGPAAIADYLEQMNVLPTPSAPGQSPPTDDEFAALQAALNQESRALTNLRHAIADCSGRVKLNDSGVPVCAAVSGGVSTAAPGVGKFFTNTEAVGAIVALLALWGLVLGLRKWRHVKDVLDDTRKSLHLAQDTHSALRTLYDALRVQVDRAKELLHAGDQATMDDVADATRRGVFVALGVDYREVPRDADIVQAVSDKVATLKDRYHELASQIRRARGALRVADDADLARAAQTRMDELTTERKERAALISKVSEALGELGAYGADVDEIALHARRATEEIHRLGAELAYAQRGSEQAQEERVRIADAVRLPRDANGALAETVGQWVARAARAEQALLEIKDLQAREIAERGIMGELPEEPLEAVIMGHGLLAQEAAQTRAAVRSIQGNLAQLHGLHMVASAIRVSLDGAGYFYAHPYARPRRKKDGQMVDSPRREQFGRLIHALRGVFPAQPPSPKPDKPRRRRGKTAVSATAAASA